MCRPSAKLPCHYISVIAKTLSKLRTGPRPGVGSYSWAITPGYPSSAMVLTAGMAGLLGMTPVAITSTAGWVRRMGYKRWQKLHRTVYFCGIAGMTHYYLLVKSDIRLPLLYGAILAVLLGYRVIKTPAQPQSSPASRGGSGRLDPARHAQARTQLARKILGTAVIFQVRHETAFVPDGLACLRTGMT
jgi:Ferric reductase like transmembrane component